jgi:hypothetical protein
MSYRKVGRRIEKTRRKVRLRENARPVKSKKELKKLTHITGRVW